MTMGYVEFNKETNRPRNSRTNDSKRLIFFMSDIGRTKDHWFYHLWFDRREYVGIKKVNTSSSNGSSLRPFSVICRKELFFKSWLPPLLTAPLSRRTWNHIYFLYNATTLFHSLQLSQMQKNIVTISWIPCLPNHIHQQNTSIVTYF